MNIENLDGIIVSGQILSMLYGELIVKNAFMCQLKTQCHSWLMQFPRFLLVHGCLFGRCILTTQIAGVAVYKGTKLVLIGDQAK